MMFKAIVLLTVVLAVANAFVCPPDMCSRVHCDDLTGCQKSNGQKVREKGGFCQCCDICVKVLGEGQTCVPEGEILGVIIASECAEDMMCDIETRKCRRIGF